MLLSRHYIIWMMLLIPCQVYGSIEKQNRVPVPDSLRRDTTVTVWPLNLKRTNDSIKNTDPIFEYLKSRQSKNKLNEWLGNLLLRDRDTTRHDDDERDADDLSHLLNKTIDTIILVRLDPFGTSIDDTTRRAERWIDKTGNNLRLTTAQRIIKKNITIKIGQRLDFNDLQESERILRQLEFIADARILVNPGASNPDNVDIVVITRDRFPHAFSTGGSLSSPQLTLYTRNLTGHGVGFSHTSQFGNGDQIGYRERISINNIEKSRINVGLTYAKLVDEHSYTLRADRSFFISQLKYAGGFLYNRSFENKRHPFNSQISWDTYLDYKFTNIWLGRSFMLESQNYFDKSHFYLTGQYVYSNFFDVPDSLADHPSLQQNRYFFGALTLSKRNYYQNKKIYNFDRTEDVPYGFMASLILGFNEAPHTTRPYIKGHFSFGTALSPDKGYVYGKIEVGTYFNHWKSEQGEIILKGKYISPLFESGRNQIRNFVELEYIKGFNRYPDEELLIIEKNRGITGFSDRRLTGKEKLVLKTESVLFTPHRLAGFNLIVLGFADLGIIGDGRSGLFRQDYQASLGGAIRLINNKLVFNTIQIRLAWLPLLDNSEVPLDFRISGESPLRFDDFIPGPPRQDTFN